MAILTGSTVTITWPAVPSRKFTIRIVDDATGRDLAPETLTATVMVDARGITTASLWMLTDADGNPAAANGPALLTEDGRGYRTGTFTYVVSAMAVEEL